MSLYSYLIEILQKNIFLLRLKNIFEKITKRKVK